MEELMFRRFDCWIPFNLTCENYSLYRIQPVHLDSKNKVSVLQSK